MHLLSRAARTRAAAVLAATIAIFGVGTVSPIAAHAAPSAYSAFDLDFEGAPPLEAYLNIVEEPYVEGHSLGMLDANGRLTLAGNPLLTTPRSVLVTLITYPYPGDRRLATWWDGSAFSTDRAAAKPINLVATGGETLRHTVVPASGGISGIVTLEDGPGESYLKVTVISAATRDHVTTMEFYSGAPYELRGLDDGRYLLQFFADRTWSPEFPYPYSSRWYPDSYEPEGAQIVTITGGELLTGLDVSLPYGAPDPVLVDRLAGADRFATSASLSSRTFPEPGVQVAYITNGLNFPDALSAAPVAYSQDGPVLLVAPTFVPEAVRAELERLNPQRIVVLGNTPSVSAAVEADLAGFTDGDVVRLAGDDRFETSAMLSRDHFEPGVPKVFVANGLNYPDALAAAAVAGPTGAPILLVTPSSIPAVIAAELDRLDPREIVILGNTPSVGSAVEGALAEYPEHGRVSRLAGTDRFATAAKISQQTFEPGVPVVYITNGYNFPDALAASAVAGREGGPILLVAQDFVPNDAYEELERLRPERIVILGQHESVSQWVELTLKTYMALRE